MAFKRRRVGNTVKRSGLVILFLLVCTGIFAQERSPLEVQIDKTTVSKKERIHFTVIVDHDDFGDITVIEPEEMDDMGIYSGPSKRTITEMLPNSRKKIRKCLFSYTFRAYKTGRKVIPPFIFIIDGKSYSTEEIMVEIGLTTKKELYIPYEAYWSPAFTEAYVGEAIPVSLYVKNELQISLFPKVRTTAPNGGFWEEVTGLGQIEQGLMAGNIVYTIPVSGYIFTPSRDGRLVIRAAEIETEVSRGKANSVIINVNPIPEEINATGAIGNLDYSYSVDRNKTYLGEEIILKVEVSGTGNLNYLQIPEPEFVNLEFLESRRYENIHAFPGGYTGKRTEEFVYQTENVGEARISVHPFASLNRETGEVEIVNGAEISIDVQPPLVKENDKKTRFFPVARENLDKYEHKELYNDPLNYLLLLPGIISLLAALIFRHRKASVVFFMVFLMIGAAGSDRPGINKIGSKPWDMYNSETYFEAGKAFYQVALEYENNSALYYNAALSFFRAGEPGKAVAILRKAVFLDPYENSYRKLSSVLEETESLPFQEVDIISLHPDLFFILLLITWNLSCAAYTVAVFRKGSILVIILIFLTICTLMSASGMAIVTVSRSRDIGIVRYDSTKVKKIPRDNSGASYLLNSGQTLSLEGFSDPYYLIETKNGITGWLHKNDIYNDTNELTELLPDGESDE